MHSLTARRSPTRWATPPAPAAQTSNATLNVTINGHTDLVVAPDAGNVTEDATPNTATGNVLTNDTSGTATKP